MIIMAIDYGDVRTGVAVCDKSELLASPVSVLSERSAERLAAIIKDLAEQYRAEALAVGLPRNMDGTEGFRARACREFALLLERETGLPVVLRDERLTTVSAHQYLSAADVRGKKRKETVDAVAAVIILEDYLAFRKNQRS